MKHDEAMRLIWEWMCPACNNRMSGEKQDGQPGWFFRCFGQKGKPVVNFEGCPAVEGFPVEIIEARTRNS
ncbi:hypothetical protein LCGC14_3047630 [marine sediment metagenome]|uniref:Uncharacterized protein n=1 Tax=marine sediment metagenome TaxID=412755 RepID=A0A0F8ZDK4_9ZZZZ